MDGASALTRSRLTDELRALGVREGGVLMVHTRMSALGWVVGAAETVVHALLDVLGPEGTLMAYVSWEDHVYHEEDWPAEHRDAYRAEPPVFDLRISESSRDHGRVPERIRTWPGAQRSFHPEASVVAIGARASWLTADHPQDEGYGAASPFARLCEAGGQVLLLGAPLETLTILHHAEGIADVPDKRLVTFRVLVCEDGVVTEREYTDIDTSRGAVPYEQLDLGGKEDFHVIGTEALAAGLGVRGSVGAAECHLFDAAPLTRSAPAGSRSASAASGCARTRPPQRRRRRTARRGRHRRGPPGRRAARRARAPPAPPRGRR